MNRTLLWNPGIRTVRRLLAALLVLYCLPSAATAQVRADVYVSGLAAPVAFVQDPSTASVQYIVEQGGRIRVVRNGVLQADSFLDLTADISAGGERGLLGLALSPDYESSGRLYVNFTNPAGHTVVARFKRSTANPLAADRSTRFDLQWPGGDRFITQPFANHNGGTLVFGPDGFLYIGMGDGGSGDDPFHNAQSPASLLGKMLRLDVSVADSDVEGYDVPSDNPFVDAAPVPALPEIWAFGLRNPWKFSFDDPARGGTGAVVIADVGQGSWEEIDYEPSGRGGRNYGWRNREGAHAHVTNLPLAYQPPVEPIFEYDHGTGQSITGGFVYRGTSLGPNLVGRYFFADISGRVWSLALTVDPATGEAAASELIEHTAALGGSSALGLISSFGVDATGELYIVSLTQGQVLRLSSSAPIDPDTDADGLPDGWEQQYGLDLQVGTGDDGGAGDPDGDGFTNLQEFQRGSHPTRRAVWPRLLDVNSDRGGDVFLYNPTTGARRFEVTNRLTSGFTAASATWDPGWQVYPATLNRDEYTDFFLYDPVRGLWVQALNHGGDGTFSYTVGNWDAGWTVVPGDLDGDGLADLLVYNAASGVWVKCFVDGAGGFLAYAADTWAPGWTLTPADLNGDGRGDVLLYNRGTGAWLEAVSQAGAGGFDYPAAGQWDPGWQVIPADLTGDGRMDLVLLNASGGHVSALSRAGGGFDYVGGPAWTPGWSVAPGDLDGDGTTDLFLYDAATGVWVVAWSDGGGAFTYAAGQWDPGWAVTMTDFNEDGRGDLLLSRGDGTWVQATNAGAASFTYAGGNWGDGWTVYTSAASGR
ncbi:MAG: PQQ-dependent sugar dehydrogenase [Acidobacteriota bacterium]